MAYLSDYMRNRYSHHKWHYQGELGEIDLKEPRKPIEISCPARLGIGPGEWTDMPPYFFNHPGAVINMSFDNLGLGIKINYSDKFNLFYNGKKQKLESNLPIKIALEFLRLNPNNLCFELLIINSIPHGSGLGGSGILVGTALAGIFSYFNIEFTKEKLLNYTLEIEQLMGSGGGWQDLGGALWPGIKLIKTSPDKPGQYSVSYLIDKNFERHCLVVYSGKTRKAANILHQFRHKYIWDQVGVELVLKQYYQDALSAWQFIKQKKYLDYAQLVKNSWRKICSIQPGIRFEFVNQLENIIGQDLAVAKVSGAGAGGFVFLMLKNPAQRDLIANKLVHQLGRVQSVYFPKARKFLC